VRHLLELVLDCRGRAKRCGGDVAGELVGEPKGTRDRMGLLVVCLNDFLTEGTVLREKEMIGAMR
jgi:hypothetical protein